MIRSLRYLTILAIALLFVRHSCGQTSTSAQPCPSCGQERALVAASQIVGINALVWSYDRYLANEDWARITPKSWIDNFTSTPEWDHNPLISNQFAHPYHGSLYYNAARSNGFGYWKSFGFSVLGSSIWEFLGEVYRPSPNDLITTSIGGTALGETFSRLSGALLASRRGRSLVRRTVATLLDPAGSLNRGLGTSGANAADLPSSIELTYRGGAETDLGDPGNTWRPAFAVDVEYGFLFADEVHRPFDVMRFGFKAGVGETSSIDRLESRGALSSSILKQGQTAVGLFQHFDYLKTATLAFGGQSVTAGVADRRKLPGGLSLTTAAHAGILIFGSTPARFVDSADLFNDYGPGGIVKVDGRLAVRGFELLRVRADAFVLQGITKSNGRHVAVSGVAELNIPLLNGFSIGGSVEFSHRSSYDSVLRDPASSASRIGLMARWGV